MNSGSGQNLELEVAGAIHLLALQAISTYRRWAPGDLAFQGGTSLHLAFGSARYSEDLDFLMRTELSDERSAAGPSAGASTTATAALVAPIAERCEQQVRAGLMRFFPDAQYRLSFGKEENNPRVFWISMASSQFARHVKVKVEFYTTRFADSYRSALRPILPRDPNVARYVSTQSFLPVATLDELLLDKVHAIAMRPYMKARDFYDIWYLSAQNVLRPRDESWLEGLARHATMYGDSADELPGKFTAKLAAVNNQQSRDQMVSDLRQWLPDVNDAFLSTCLDESFSQLERIRDEVENECVARDHPSDFDEPDAEGPKP